MPVYIVFLIAIKIIAFWFPIHFYQEYQDKNAVVRSLHGQSALHLRYVLPELKSGDQNTEILVHMPRLFEVGKSYTIRYEIKNYPGNDSVEFAYLAPEGFSSVRIPVTFNPGGPTVIEREVYYNPGDAPDKVFYVRAELIAKVKSGAQVQKYQSRYMLVYSPQAVEKVEAARTEKLVMAIVTLILAIAVLIMLW